MSVYLDTLSPPGREASHDSHHRTPHRVALARILAVLLAILLVHWIDAFGLAYFTVLGMVAVLLLASHFVAVPGLLSLQEIDTSDRLAIWIVLAVFAVIGFLHNANTWVPDGAFNRPTHVSLWKTELVLSISLAAPPVLWMVAALLPRLREAGGRVRAGVRPLHQWRMAGAIMKKRTAINRRHAAMGLPAMGATLHRAVHRRVGLLPHVSAVFTLVSPVRACR